MKLLLGLVLLALADPTARGQSIEIVSPKQAYTFAYGDAISHQIERDHLTNEMIARVTFSNYPTPAIASRGAMKFSISFFLVCNSMRHETNFSRVLPIARGFQSQHCIRIFHTRAISSSQPRKFFS
ncbi:MAG: hypothetical protein DME45_08720 [Verrucomicrobia bacterium]|nr:MAG: hypothetical protein DME45_08720 [Verrucomicrobiota bacterium]